MLLTRSRAATEPSAATALTAPPVLLVEDWQGLREVFAELLEHEGYAVTAVPDGAEALRHLESGARPALILLDLEMPVLDGWGLLAQLQDEPEYSAIPVVLLSGVETLPLEARRLGVDGYLRKPVEPDILLQVVRMFCGAPLP